MGELILVILVTMYFFYGFYALYRESGRKILIRLRDISHRLVIGLKRSCSRTGREKKIGRKLQRKQG